MSQSYPSLASRLRAMAQYAPVYFVFFTWSIGTGAQNLGRPLFAFEASGTVLLVTVMLAGSAVARVVAAPITGFLTDRVGRKPLVIFGAGLRGVTNFAEFVVEDYVTFFVLEFIGAIGVSMWMTSSSILLADVSPGTSRGRMVAARSMTMRVGFILGPLIGGLLIAWYGDIRTVFLFNGITKVVLIVVAYFLIKETMPEPNAPAGSRGRRPESDAGKRLNLSDFMTRTFFAVVIATLATSMMMTGFFQGVFPIHATDSLGITEAQLGFLTALGSAISLLVAFPNGVLSDRLGRKASLVPGLLLLAASAALLAVSESYTMLVIMVLSFGAAQGMTQGTSQVFAMDLAPPDRRGSFLGVWNIFQHLGSVVMPLFIGTLYTVFNPATAFNVVALGIVVSAVLLAVMAKETVGQAQVLGHSEPAKKPEPEDARD